MPASKRLLNSLLLSLSLSLLCVATAWSAPTFSLSASPPGTIAPGGSMTLSVLADGVSDLYGYQFSLNFDPTLFQANAVTEGPFLATGGATFFDGGVIDNALGSISFIFGTLIAAVPGVSGSGVLDTISFTALSGGFGTFSLVDVIALDSNLGDLPVLTLGTTVAVPEPGMPSLVIAALLALLWVRWRHSRVR